MPAESQIEQTARRKLHSRDDEGTRKGPKEKRKVGQSSVGKKYEAEAQTAADGHRPMGVPAKGDFYGIVACGPRKVEEREKENRKTVGALFWGWMVHGFYSFRRNSFR